MRATVMCGICGTIGISQQGLIEEMTETLRHRGPDGSGIYRHGDVALGHRRLSVIDIDGGAQPMRNRDGSLTIVYNGEIYNYRELKKELEGRGHRFETASDTEVLLRMYEECGGPRALSKLNGMFAFAVYDRERDELFVARDRIGIKPLYYQQLPERFLFASEAKAIHCYREAPRTLNPFAIHDYLGLRYVPGDTTMFQEVKRLPAGHYLTYRRGRITIQRYWEPPRYDGPYVGDEDYFEQFSELMETSVRRRLISDVSFGAYLSGGVDSSVIVALMARLNSAPVKTFSVGFDYEHDELSQAAATAQHLGCDHTEIACHASDVVLLPEIVHYMDDPMGDAINIPMFQLSRAAKEQVTVILTGEGGDEILGGYLFHKVMRLGDVYRRVVPQPIRDWVLQPLLAAAPAGVLNLAFRYPAYLGKRGKLKALDYLKLLDPSKIDHAYRHLISLFDAREMEQLYQPEFRERLIENDTLNGQRPLSNVGTDGHFVNRMLRLSFDHWLPDNMLLRTDKMGMAHAIEGRVPYLDHELVEFALRLPPRLKLRHLTGKYILRRLASRLTLDKVARRRKMPFYVPVENYFEQPAFREMMEELLSDRAVAQRGIFKPEAVARPRKMMHRREFIFVKQVFSLMVLELWFRIFVDRTWRITNSKSSSGVGMTLGQRTAS